MSVKKRNPHYPYPAVMFKGGETALMLNRILPENLADIARKVELRDGAFPRGFIHTSTVEHEFTNYYRQCWTRDGGRGLIELARFGDAERARAAAEYFSKHITHGDHFGRTIVEKPGHGKHFELDGNALILLGCYRAYLINECDPAWGRSLLDQLFPVFGYWETGMENCPHADLIPCETELSGNPNTDFVVYGIFPNYAALCAIAAFCQLAKAVGDDIKLEYLSRLHTRLERAIEEKLISGKTPSKTRAGAFINAMDPSGNAYDTADWVGLRFDAYRSTRQLCGILESDAARYGYEGRFKAVHTATYRYINDEMAKNIFYRKYGFAGVNCFHGAGGRHDETMCGYGQSFFTQAALLADDVAASTKLIAGLCRLAYDGDVVKPLTNDLSPFIVHECFSYENFEQGDDHTFGVLKNGRPFVHDNEGDEGNLVQEAEAVKAIALIIGVENPTPGQVRLIPRLPWDVDGIEVYGYPVIHRDGKRGPIDFSLTHRRYERCCEYSLRCEHELRDVDIRIGPFPAYCEMALESNMTVEPGINASFVWIKGLSGREINGAICLK